MRAQHKYGLFAIVVLGATSFATVHTLAAKKTEHKNIASNKTRPKSHKQGAGGSFPVTTYDAHTATDNQYSVTGNGQGQVIVTVVPTGNVIQTLQMDANVPVRQVFLLQNDQVVGAAQKDHTIFWNILTGVQVAQLSEEVYGFSQDETVFFSYVPQVGATYSNGSVNVYSYPGLQQLGQLETSIAGPEAWNFSPDKHYLVIEYNGLFPAPDATYPDTDNSDRNFRKTYFYDLTNFQYFAPLSVIMGAPVGSFSADSTTYSLSGSYFDPANPATESNSTSWQYSFPNAQLTPLN